MTTQTINARKTNRTAVKQEAIALGIGLAGCLLGLFGYWMYLEAGGTLLQQPRSDLYLIPSVVGCILCVVGYAGLFTGRKVEEPSPVEETKREYVTGELSELELEAELEQHEEELIEYE